LIISATIIFNIVLYATLPAEVLTAQIGNAAVRICVELLYNSGILLLIVGLSDRRQQTHPHYRLP